MGLLRSFRALAALLLVFFIALPVQAQTRVCGDHDKLVAVLLERHGERVVVRAITGAGFLIEILASKAGTSWTSIVTPPGSPNSCVFDEGEGLEIYRPFSQGPEPEAHEPLPEPETQEPYNP